MGARSRNLRTVHNKLYVKGNASILGLAVNEVQILNDYFVFLYSLALRPFLQN